MNALMRLLMVTSRELDKVKFKELAKFSHMGRTDLNIRWEQVNAKAKELKEVYKKPKALHNFYKSKTWLLARTIKINATHGKCERCGAIGEEVHHKIISK